MEDILETIYNRSFDKKILDVKTIEDIMMILIYEKKLDKYISYMEVISENNHKAASYCNYMKKITINSKCIEYILNDINKNVLISNDFEKIFYQNLSILQILLHELEHANQDKLINDNNEIDLETSILKIAEKVDTNLKAQLYEICPEERLAEIKSFNEICHTILPIRDKLSDLFDVIKIEELQRLLRGYHYNDGSFIESPLIHFINKSNNQNALYTFNWYDSNVANCLKNVTFKYMLYERLKYGLPISINEYAYSMHELIISSKGKIRNRILI